MSTPDDAQAVAERSARAMYETDEASRALGIEVDQVGPGSARAQMAIRDDMVNGHGIAHGGYVFLLADTAFAFACNTYGSPAVARQCEISFLRPAQAGDRLCAVAHERARSGGGGIYDVRVTDSSGQIVAELRGHSAALRTNRGTA